MAAPIELMWVARTISLLEKDDWEQRPLPGRRRVAPWVDSKRTRDRFGLTPEQFRAYRQTGSYGGYRRAFRKWPGLTLGDGWTPGQHSVALANWLDGKLNGARLQLADDLGRGAKMALGKEQTWWLRQWANFSHSDKSSDLKNTLPRQRGDFFVLPEAQLLKPIIFGDDASGQKRLLMVQAIAISKGGDLETLRHHLSQHFHTDPTIARLAAFSRLADAGLAAMDLVAQALNGQPEIALTEVARQKAAKGICKTLHAAAQDWLAEPDMVLRHADAAARFATAISTADPIKCLGKLLRHHETYGGGLRWFVLRNDRVEAVHLRATEVARYGFRLWSLCRLAVQCGVLASMPKALHDDTDWEDQDA
ncbi:MAG: hypothetical protein IPJ18_00705 [Betaproteobacteria bacterium]|nr:hypothetical protein [Betaproteobacteria bacterium]